VPLWGGKRFEDPPGSKGGGHIFDFNTMPTVVIYYVGFIFTAFTSPFSILNIMCHSWT